MFNWSEAFSKDAYEFSYKDVDSEVTPEFARNLRMKLKLSQKMFAKILGISDKTVEKWEQGKNPIKGTSSRILFLLNKHEELLDDLYMVKREDEELSYYSAYVVRTVKKPKNLCVQDKDIKFKPSKGKVKEELSIKNASPNENSYGYCSSI